MNSNNDFSNAKVGDLVTSLTEGYGVITWIDPTDDDFLNIKVTFKNGLYYLWFSITGESEDYHFAPTLFKGHIDINSLSINYNTI